MRKKDNREKSLFFLFIGMGFLFLLLLSFSPVKKTISSRQEDQAEPKTLASAGLDQGFVFSAKDKTEQEVGEVAFDLIEAKKESQIKIKGDPIEAESGKAFLVLNFEIENKTNKPLFLYPADFVRLLGNDDKRFAPDFHNGMAQVEPISVRKDQLAFIVSDQENNFVILVGEIEAEKEQVEINF